MIGPHAPCLRGTSIASRLCPAISRPDRSLFLSASLPVPVGNSDSSFLYVRLLSIRRPGLRFPLDSSASTANSTPQSIPVNFPISVSSSPGCRSTKTATTLILNHGSFLKRYTYNEKSQFLDVVQSECARFEASNSTSEFLLFHASKATIENIIDPRNADASLGRFCTSFDTNEQLLPAKMAGTKTHAAAADGISYDPAGLGTNGLDDCSPGLSACTHQRG